MNQCQTCTPHCGYFHQPACLSCWLQIGRRIIDLPIMICAALKDPAPHLFTSPTHRLYCQTRQTTLSRLRDEADMTPHQSLNSVRRLMRRSHSTQSCHRVTGIEKLGYGLQVRIIARSILTAGVSLQMPCKRHLITINRRSPSTPPPLPLPQHCLRGAAILPPD